MKNIKRLTLFLFLLLISCMDLKNKNTKIEIENNNRHYHPILFGNQINLKYKIKNIGKNPLIISDIFTSCSCVTVENNSKKIIQPGKENTIHLTYSANMTVGFNKHFISLYGNFEEDQHQELVFDIYVVPITETTEEYDETFREKMLMQGNNKSSNNNYYFEKINR